MKDARKYEINTYWFHPDLLCAPDYILVIANSYLTYLNLVGGAYVNEESEVILTFESEQDLMQAMLVGAGDDFAVYARDKFIEGLWEKKNHGEM